MNLCKRASYQIRRLLWLVDLCLLAGLTYNDSVVISILISSSLTKEWRSSFQLGLELRSLEFWQFLPLFYKKLWISTQNLQIKYSYYLQSEYFILFLYKNNRESKIIEGFFGFLRFTSYGWSFNIRYRYIEGRHRSFRIHKTQDFCHSFEVKIYTKDLLIELS